MTTSSASNVDLICCEFPFRYLLRHKQPFNAETRRNCSSFKRAGASQWGWGGA